MGGNVGVQLREALYVQLVNDRVMPRRPRRPIVAPGECGVDDAAFGHSGGVVAPVHGQIFARTPDAVAEQRVAPLDAAIDIPARAGETFQSSSD
jgi:hypothetical protein